MPELRQNLATQEWVVIATERARRPHDFAVSDRILTHQRPEYVKTCPFCPGNEDHTRPTLLQLPDEKWLVRVFSNLYPALTLDGSRDLNFSGIYRRLNGVGYHEVIVESPRHNTTPGTQTSEEILFTLKAFQERGREIIADRRIEHIVYFKNHGSSAGGSLEHPHSQLVALPVVPAETRRRIEIQRAFFDDSFTCSICEMLEEESDDGRRIIDSNSCFTAFIPYAASAPFLVWIVPHRHGPTFLDQLPHELQALAEIMKSVLGRLYRGLHDPDYNYIIRTAPVRDSSSAYIHWYISIVPRITKAAGFEISTGMFINPSLPEESAKFLHEQLPDSPLS